MQDRILAIEIFISLLSEPPKDELLKTLKDENLWQDWVAPNDSPLEKEALEILSSLDERAEDIGADYTSLFISDIPLLKAPMHASYYLSESGEVESSFSDSTKDFYLANDFHSFSIPADSMLNELCFIAFLLKNQKLEILDEFLQKYFFIWFYKWSDDVIANAKSRFYHALGMLMRSFFVGLRLR